MDHDSRIESDHAVDRNRSKSRPNPVNVESSERTDIHSLDRDALGKTIGAMFRSARKAQRLSQDQVAALIDGPPVSRTTISAIEGGRMPNVEALVSLSNALHVDPMEVLERVHLASPLPIDLTDLGHDELLRRGEEFLWAGDYRKALAVYDAMLERLTLDAPADKEEFRRRRARIEINRAVALRRCSALSAAQATAQRAVEMARDLPDLQAEAYMVLASVLSLGGFLTLANVAAEQAVTLSATADPVLKGRGWNQRGNVLYRMGLMRDARHAFLEARKLLLQTERYHDQIKVEGNIGACLLELGERSAARQRFKTAIELARKHPDGAAEAFWLIELGRMALDDGEYDQAESYATAALGIAKPNEQHLNMFRAEWLMHLVVRARDPEAADRHRLAYLRKLYTRVQEHRGLSVIKEFEATVLRPSDEKHRSTS